MLGQMYSVKMLHRAISDSVQTGNTSFTSDSSSDLDVSHCTYTRGRSSVLLPAGLVQGSAGVYPPLRCFCV